MHTTLDSTTSLVPGTSARPASLGRRRRPPQPARAVRARVVDTITPRLKEILRKARPAPRSTPGGIPQVVSDTTRKRVALLTRTFLRAWAWLCANPLVPIETLYAVAFALVCDARERRGIPAPDLFVAMRVEEATNAALNLRQWCRPGVTLDALTEGDLAEIEQHAGEQLLASQDLMHAAHARRRQLEAARPRRVA